jgi:hypothetical protein
VGAGLPAGNHRGAGRFHGDGFERRFPAWGVPPMICVTFGYSFAIFASLIPAGCFPGKSVPVFSKAPWCRGERSR